MLIARAPLARAGLVSPSAGWGGTGRIARRSAAG